MQLGLRGINAFGGNNGDPRNADAARDITIEGGSGNILNGVRLWSNANETSLWNSDPALQLWMVAAQFEMTGIGNATRFAVTPDDGKPTDAYLKTHDLKQRAQQIYQRRSQKMKADGNMKDVPAPQSLEQLEAALKTGRHLDDVPLNATEEQTFFAGKADLTKGERAAGKIPGPPVVPATDAPLTRRPVAFTQTADFGKELLALGADPTGVSRAMTLFRSFSMACRAGSCSRSSTTPKSWKIAASPCRKNATRRNAHCPKAMTAAGKSLIGNTSPR
jgi:hypothetical protein